MLNVLGAMANNFGFLQNGAGSNSSSDEGCNSGSNPTMELSFEYLMAKNILKWISITSEHAMLMSVCLQSIVDELLNQKDGHDLRQNIDSVIVLLDMIIELMKFNFLSKCKLIHFHCRNSQLDRHRNLYQC